MDCDLTLSEVIVDPLIAELRRADHIGNAAFAQLMESAARVQTRHRIELLHAARADAFYSRLAAVSERQARA
jgi:hypothetical protein